MLFQVQMIMGRKDEVVLIPVGDRHFVALEQQLKTPHRQLKIS